MVRITDTHNKPTLTVSSKTNGRIRNSNGYILIRKPEHPNSVNGYVQEHRLIIEKHLGRLLTKDELIHHKNENKDDNRIENLEIVCSGKHRGIHNTLNKKGKRKYDIDLVGGLYLQGLSNREVARKTGIGKSTVASYVRELGISRSQMSKRDEEGKFVKRKVVI